MFTLVQLRRLDQSQHWNTEIMPMRIAVVHIQAENNNMSTVVALEKVVDAKVITLGDQYLLICSDFPSL